MILKPELARKNCSLTLDDIDVDPASLEDIQLESTLKLNPNITSLTGDSVAFEFSYQGLYKAVLRGLKTLRKQDIDNEKRKRKRELEQDENDTDKEVGDTRPLEKKSKLHG